MPDGKAWIDGLREAGGQLPPEAVREILPYGDDFLFVDRVTSLTDDEIVASYRIPPDSRYLRAHFRDFPIMPAALIAEGFAQAGTIVVRYALERPRDKDVLGLQIESARFLAPSYPGDTLTYRVRRPTMDRRAARLEGEVFVGERRVAKIRLVVGIVDRETFRKR